MTATLQVCPACGAQVSMAAPSCVHCGHPLKSSGLNLTYVVWFLVGGCLLLLGFGIYRLGLLELPAAKVSPAPQSTLAPSVFMTDKELTVELRSYVIRANRTLPHKPNPMLTLERIGYKPAPHHLTYDYELNAAAGLGGIDLETVRPALMRRYCQDEVFRLASTNDVAVTWRYLQLGRIVHEETIQRCEI